MRTAPAARFTLAAGRTPRVLVSAISALAAGSAALWAARKMAWPGEVSSAGAVAAALVVFAMLMAYHQCAAVSLRWDGGLWQLARADGAVETPGDLAVVVDIGPWMLLRFDAGPGVSPLWLSAHQSGVKPRWHALRCAVYSPRPAATPDASVEEAAL